MTSPGQFSNTNFEEVESLKILNSLPSGNLPAIDTNLFTFLITRSFPDRLEKLSGFDLRRLLRFVRKPTVMIVTLLSGSLFRIFLYISTASATSEVDLIECGYFSTIESAQCCDDPRSTPALFGAPTGNSLLPK